MSATARQYSLLTNSLRIRLAWVLAFDFYDQRRREIVGDPIAYLIHLNLLPIAEAVGTLNNGNAGEH